MPNGRARRRAYARRQEEALRSASLEAEAQRAAAVTAAAAAEAATRAAHALEWPSRVGAQLVDGTPAEWDEPPLIAKLTPASERILGMTYVTGHNTDVREWVPNVDCHSGMHFAESRVDLPLWLASRRQSSAEKDAWVRSAHIVAASPHEYSEKLRKGRAHALELGPRLSVERWCTLWMRWAAAQSEPAWRALPHIESGGQPIIRAEHTGHYAALVIFQLSRFKTWPIVKDLVAWGYVKEVLESIGPVTDVDAQLHIALAPRGIGLLLKHTDLGVLSPTAVDAGLAVDPRGAWAALPPAGRTGARLLRALDACPTLVLDLVAPAPADVPTAALQAAYVKAIMSESFPVPRMSTHDWHDNALLLALERAVATKHSDAALAATLSVLARAPPSVLAKVPTTTIRAIAQMDGTLVPRYFKGAAEADPAVRAAARTHARRVAALVKRTCVVDAAVDNARIVIMVVAAFLAGAGFVMLRATSH